jgi:hypothetical protein
MWRADELRCVARLTRHGIDTWLNSLESGFAEAPIDFTDQDDDRIDFLRAETRVVM